MCGICGIVYKDPKKKPERAVLKRMCDTIVHRGPDDEGQTVRGQAGLGMRRLSIIDLQTGQQPLSNEDKTVWVVFNGEIYNFQEVRAELEKKGHRFTTSSDTESIVHGWEEWGEDVCSRFNGMFAFAVWDDAKRLLFIARDRLGVKPLYYYQDDEKFVFGSEIKAILPCPGVRRNLDHGALNRYLTFEYIPAPRTIFREIRKLEAGHALVLQDGQSRIRSYWELVPREDAISESDAQERLRELVRDSVKLRLISDVPLGAFLSGGIDSSIVVSQMAGAMTEPVKTFSIGFKESSYNELPYARAVARKYGTEHHEFIIEPQALELTETLVKMLDEPFGDFSIFPTYLVSKMAREYVTVCLSGDGGDELFAGYDTYRAQRLDRRYYHRLPKMVKNGILLPIAGRLSPTEKKKGTINSVKRFLEGTRLPKSLEHVRWMVFLQEEERRKLFSAPMLETLGNDDPYDFILEHGRKVQGLSDITRMGYVDVKTYLVDDILVKVDRMSMAVSLEARTPYLDYRLVEFAFTLPPALKMKAFKTKTFLKKAFWNEFPPEVQNRGKQGFSIPIKSWIRNELRGMMTDLLSESRIRRQGLFNPAAVKTLMDEHLQGVQNHSHKLWALMVFEQWMDIYN